jgi:hypothetical protein
MKKKYLLFIVCLACLTMVTTAQASHHLNCFVIAKGRSSGMEVTGGGLWGKHFILQRYIGAVPYISFSDCRKMTVVIIEREGIQSYSDVSCISLTNTFGTFVWRAFPDYYFGLMPKTSVKAFALEVSVS